MRTYRTRGCNILGWIIFKKVEKMQMKINLKKKIVSVLLSLIMVSTAILGCTLNSYAFSTFTSKSPYSSTGHSTYYHNKDKFNKSLLVHGVDISSYQDKASNFVSMKKDGVEMAILRVSLSYLSSGKKEEDWNWKSHIKKARDAGIMIGLYHFSQAKTVTEARSEANYICNLYEKGIKQIYGSKANPKAYLDLPIYMDYEFGSGSRIYDMSKSARTKCAKAFCSTIKTRGYDAGLYACKSFLDNNIDGNAVAAEHNDIWVAQYWKKCEYTKNYGKWQYSSSAKISGIKSGGKQGRADVNFWYLNKNYKAPNSNEKNIANCKVSKIKKQSYTAKPVRPSFTVKFKGNKIGKNKAYTVGYFRNVKTGTAYVYIRGIGAYKGYKIVSFKINPKKKVSVPKTKLNKLTGKSKAFIATWEKKTGIKGYQIQYSRFSDMSLDLKEKVTPNTVTKKTFQTNFNNYKYYVRIRTYKVVDGVTYYSAWSDKKTVFVK